MTKLTQEEINSMKLLYQMGLSVKNISELTKRSTTTVGLVVHGKREEDNKKKLQAYHKNKLAKQRKTEDVTTQEEPATQEEPKDPKAFDKYFMGDTEASNKKKREFEELQQLSTDYRLLVAAIYDALTEYFGPKNNQ